MIDDQPLKPVDFSTVKKGDVLYMSYYFHVAQYKVTKIGKRKMRAVCPMWDGEREFDLTNKYAQWATSFRTLRDLYRFMKLGHQFKIERLEYALAHHQWEVLKLDRAIEALTNETSPQP